MSNKQTSGLLAGSSVLSPGFLQSRGKVHPQAGTAGFGRFLMALLVVFPLWLCVLLPVALITYPFSFLMKKKKPARAAAAPTAPAAITPNATQIPLADRRLDVVLFGATGFTGRLAARYMARAYGTKVRWGIAGRRAEALNALRASLAAEVGDPALTEHVQVITADAQDEGALRALAESTRVVATTAGPFSLHGTALVSACVRAGTSYADITGETDWVRAMIDGYDECARATGARIVHFAGHDCIPWDLCVYKIAEKLRTEHNGEALTSVTCYDQIVGTASGGTLATLFHSLEGRTRLRTALAFDPLMKPNSTPAKDAPAAAVTAAAAADAAAPSRSVTVARNQTFLGYDSKALLGQGSWVGPFVMAVVMANCIRRSNAVNNYSAGGKLVYREAIAYPGFTVAFSDMMFNLVFAVCLFNPLLLAVLKRVVPQPGDGPSEAEMDQGFLKVTAQGRGERGTQVAAAFYFPTDPGYRDTARMLVESALALALNHEQIDVGGGVYTPATCLKQVLIDRLVASSSAFEVATVSK